MKNSTKKISLQEVIKSELENSCIEQSFDSKIANIRVRFVHFLLLKNEATEMVTDKYLQSIWKLAESDLTIGYASKYVTSYTDFMLSEMLDKVSGGW
jgi:hypothetical protein